MVALRAGDVDAYIARPDPGRPITLVFGQDAGLVSERARAIVAASVDSMDDPFGLVRIEGDQLAADPARLIDEAQTVPLFGGRRAIWVRAGSRDLAPAVEALIDVPIRDCRVVIEAGDLRRNAPLRVVCERARTVAVIACYLDGERDLARLIDDEMRSAGLSIAPEARAALLPLLGGDRRASRNEVQKLALYARGNGRVELDDVMAVVADASTLTLDAVVDAVFAGRPAEAETHFKKARAAGIAPDRMITAALSQVSQLHRARLAVEQGAPMDAAADEVVSRAQFRRRPAIEAALKAWTAGRLERVMGQLAEAALETRRVSGPLAGLADPIAARALLAIATAARRKE